MTVAVVTGLVAVIGLMTSGIEAQTSANPVSDAIRAMYDSAKKNIKDSAMVSEATQAIFDFKPVDAVRTFGQVVAHTAGANYAICSAAKGEKSPNAEDAFDKLTAKAEIVKAYDGSVAYCDAIYKALTDRTAAESIDMPFGMGKAARAQALIMNSGHLNEHYGNLVTYMRIKGIVPPTSRR
ncbi:MAG TPA: DinB family protein [Vicinamibacterales bacterium]|nr:DinB family protein [Vicinamibacterales bacterium]